MKMYLILLISICAETMATTMLKASEGFTRLWPSIVVVIGYSVSFYGLSLVVKVMHVGLVYAIWAGLGIVMVSIFSFFVYGQKLDMPAIIGMLFIAAGIIIINMFSKAVTH